MEAMRELKEIDDDERRKRALFERRPRVVLGKLENAVVETTATVDAQVPVEIEDQETIVEIIEPSIVDEPEIPTMETVVQPEPSQPVAEVDREVFYECSRCKAVFLISEFATRKNPTKKKYPRCRSCQRTTQKEKMRERRVYEQVDVRTRLIEASGRKCARCGYGEFVSGIEFHHITPSEKRANIAHLVNRFSYGGKDEAWTELIVELSKCILLCSNCHQSLHRGDWKITSKIIARRISGLPATYSAP